MSVDKVPELRFEGFSGEWEEKILGEQVQLENGFAFQSKYFKKSPTEVIVLTPGSVNIGGGFQAGKGQYYDIKQEVSPRYIFKPDDMFITMTDLTPTAQALGFPAIIPRDNYTYLHNQRLGKLVGFKGDSGFLYSLLRTTKKQKEVVSTSSGTTVKHTSPDKFLNRFCFFPKNEEQIQIGDYFQKLDSLIDQHQLKYKKLSNIKKAMLERMFPKQGETIPEIRFKGFSGEWEEKELGALAEIVRGASPRPIEDPKWFDRNSSVGWLRIRDVTEQDGRIHYLEQRISKLGQEKTRVLSEKHLLLSIAASVGKPVINYVETGVHDGFLIFKKPRFELEYMYQWLKSFEERWQQYGQPGSQVNLNSDIVKSQLVTIPSNEEQQEIGNYFQKLDALIKQHQQQITKLNNIKQACLNKMFV
ncbi:restriction endonuclease subunit S [Pseudomonas sp. Fl5BN2]|uniref:restriction endonuclease subunit S n=1 Tax=Pseudomonas sp. Fl5BN2 TaxID=2697652 RepID=UPI001377E9C8|nr:restriction endonuclease subunit S [Pseudomonas sp. Fl5BN2]NBF02509.1 restriction endonuclease subunit S [Pseudomonas sp. Fl5BN2]